MKKFNLLFSQYLLSETTLTEQEIDLIASNLEFYVLKADEIIQVSGMPVNQIGFLIEGFLRAYTTDDQGVEFIRYFVSPVRFFADIDGFFFGTLAQSNIQTVTSAIVGFIQMTDVERLCVEIPGMKQAMSQISEKAIVNIYKSIEFLRFGSSTLQYKQLMENEPTLVQNVPLKYIASFLGVTKSSLSRIRKCLK